MKLLASGPNNKPVSPSSVIKKCFPSFVVFSPESIKTERERGTAVISYLAFLQKSLHVPLLHLRVRPGCRRHALRKAVRNDNFPLQ